MVGEKACLAVPQNINKQIIFNYKRKKQWRNQANTAVAKRSHSASPMRWRAATCLRNTVQPVGMWVFLPLPHKVSSTSNHEEITKLQIEEYSVKQPAYNVQEKN